jgi:hypothetical protein
MDECVSEEPKENAMNASNPNAKNRGLPGGTRVVSKLDGEAGRIERVCTYRRNGSGAWSYLVQTAGGREIWEAGELFVPATHQA